MSQVGEEDIDEEGVSLFFFFFSLSHAPTLTPFVIIPGPLSLPPHPPILTAPLYAYPDAVRSHRQFFGSDSSSQNQQQASSSTLGNAAALQALKLFTSGNQGGGGGQSQNALVGLAMAQASKLFDAQASQGNVAAGADKQSAVMKAGEMALKMYLKSQGGSGGGQGGLGGLMGLAGKFL